MVKLAHYDTIISPAITEKATMASEHGKVVFKVARSSTKKEIKEAIEALFDVKVERVNTLVRKGKQKRFRNFAGRQPDKKMAVVTLKDGDMIDVTTGL